MPFQDELQLFFQFQSIRFPGWRVLLSCQFGLDIFRVLFSARICDWNLNFQIALSREMLSERFGEFFRVIWSFVVDRFTNKQNARVQELERFH